MVRKIKITGRLLNIVHRHVRENMNQTSDSILPTMNKDVFERHTSTGITCNQTFLLPFLYVRRKVNYFPFISPTIFVLSSNKEPLIAGYNRRRDLCLDANKFVSLTANSLIEVICLKIWQNHCPRKTKRPLPADLLRSKSPQLVRVPIAARVS